MERIDKFLSNLKYGSREDIKKFIKNRDIQINDVCIKDNSLKIDPEKDVIKFRGQVVFYKKIITLMMNKPQGYLCATQDRNDRVVLDLLKEPYNRFDFKIIGRLDKDTEGLLFLTTDTALIHKYTHPKKDIFKKYYCLLEKPLERAEEIENGVIIKDQDGSEFLTKHAMIEKMSDQAVYIQITEGKFHQVKRMFEAVGNKVVYLKRVQIGDIELDPDLKLGEYKEINLS